MLLGHEVVCPLEVLEKEWYLFIFVFMYVCMYFFCLCVCLFIYFYRSMLPEVPLVLI